MLTKMFTSSGYSVTATVVYSTSTSGATHTLNVTYASVSVSGTVHSAFSRLQIEYGGSVVATADLYQDSGGIHGADLSITKTTTMTHSTQTKALKFSFVGKITIYKNDGYLTRVDISGSTASTNVSIAARPSYDVTYNANGGTGAPSKQTKWYGENLALTSSKPSRTNYVFKSWNTQANGSGTTYNPGATYTANVALALYAQWYAPYSVTFDANGGTGAPASQVKVYNQALSISTTKPTRAGYVFRRWNTNTSDTGTAYSPGSKYEANANLALHAIWNPVIAYDANGGTGAPAAQTKTFGAALTLQSGTPTRTGYTFLRWNTAKNGSGTSYNAGATMAAGSNAAVTLYAQWQQQPSAPTISSLTAIRSNSSGAASDSGTYCKVTAKWSIDTTNVSGNTATVTGVIQRDDGVAASFAITSGGSGTSGTATALISGLSTDHQYLVGVIVTDTRTSTTRATIMTRASFILDLKAGGHAMGIGSAAPDSGMEVGWATQFDQAVGMLMGLSVGGNLTVLGSIVADQLKVVSVSSDVASAASGFTLASQAAYTYGNVVMVIVTLRPTADVAANTSKSVCTLASGFRPKNTQGFSDTLGVGTITSGGSCTYRNIVALTTTSTVTVSATFVK